MIHVSQNDVERFLHDRKPPCEHLTAADCPDCRRVGLCVGIARLRATLGAPTTTSAGMRFPKRWTLDGRPVYRVAAPSRPA